MSQFLHLPDWLCGVIIIGGFVLIAVAGLPVFRWLTTGRLHLSEAMNNDVVFFAEAIAAFYSLTVGLIAVGVWSNYSSVSDIVSATQQTSPACIATSAATPNDPHRLTRTGPRLHRVHHQPSLAGTDAGRACR